MFLHKMEDSRVDCLSMLTSMPAVQYLEMIEDVYADKGKIDGQRGALKTKTAMTIRNRMVDDIKQGAILPPIVLGVRANDQHMRAIRELDSSEKLFEYLKKLDKGNISIIDGMQRTTAILDAQREGGIPQDSELRIEFWITRNLNSLIYRMLVLNTGQVPWDIGRQLETIYGQLLLQIKQSLGDEVTIFLADSKKRRAQPGQYQSKNVVELFLLFSSRKSEIEIKDRISEDFVRLDAIEATANDEVLDYFIATISLMSRLDREFSRIAPAQGAKDEDVDRINNGKDIFKSFPAMAGFCSACAIAILDEPGFPIDRQLAATRQKDVEVAITNVCDRMADMTIEQLKEFLQIELLNEKLKQRSSQVGRFEREFYRKAFASLIRNYARLETLEPCWMAH
ncbi:MULTISPECIES: hypothetical protein [Pseudomonas]|uniref:hypothetical protein n=1 Tax=Pseudomonas sp. MIL9 TaxID=2807620 RepID=UPI00194E8E78|nr:hypothetical protein [Pseudomonas sp. MIL9]MBM6447233.1 hypothetical protein [Pseudomonas sp. MIL9]